MPRITVIGDKDYQARCDAHTLREAEEIKASAARHRAAQAHAKDEMKKLEKVIKPAPRSTRVKPNRGNR